MFIIVKYGNNEELICNPSCAVVNLLNNIKKRTGFGNTPVSLDLSDETGLIKELDAHKHDYATKYLVSHNTYILVEKQMLPPDDDNYNGDGDSSSPLPGKYQYIPLLEKHNEIFPNLKLHVAEVQKKRKMRATSKSPSPAGRVTLSSKSKKKPSQSKIAKK
ncbi:uncharacterized protein CXorf65-like [Lingula anatina]|uniref:Uncharacterized protein CXorf65 n=1 Tax=Lingula anatina TaxID=7574 RepID=A0A1S3H7P0_LINAN|nr:uncharacterized protein CXorf65 [Lingula anatina]XP_013384355.1 uncharacterized protein CXorf65-like [Lingula anatina]|eukprot:XP_013382023.1 uncharacterized protein CXorf65 [Lingula anatina]